MLLNINKFLIFTIFDFLEIKDSIINSISVSHTFFEILQDKIQIYKKDLYLFEYMYPQDFAYCKFYLYGKAIFWLQEFILTHNMKKSQNPRTHIPFYYLPPNQCYYIVLNKLLYEDHTFKQSLIQYILKKNIQLNFHLYNF